MDLDVLGAAAYLAFVQTAPHSPNWRALPWAELEPGQREAWRASADAVRMMVEMRQERDQEATRSN